MPLVDAGKNSAADGLRSVVTFLSAITVIGDTATEPSGGSPAYARKAVTWNASASGKATNSGSVTFDIPPATTVYAVGFHSASTAGTFYGWAPLNPAAKGFSTVAAGDVTSDTLEAPANGLSNGNQFYVEDVFAVALPTGVARNTVYFVVSVATDTFKVSATSGGSAIDLTAKGQLFWQTLVPEVYGSQGTLTVAAGALTLDLTGI